MGVRSLPGKSGTPVSISAKMQPALQISTINGHVVSPCGHPRGLFRTCFVIVLPDEHDLGGAVVASGNVAGHLHIRDARKTKVANLGIVSVT